MITAFSTRLRYGAVAQVFHWATAILVVAAYVYGPVDRSSGSTRLPGIWTGSCTRHWA